MIEDDPHYCIITALDLVLQVDLFNSGPYPPMLVSSGTIMPPKELNFITGNKNKLAEVKAILGDTVTLRSQSLDLVEIQGTIEEISTDKCRRAAEMVSMPTYHHRSDLC